MKSNLTRKAGLLFTAFMFLFSLLPSTSVYALTPPPTLLLPANASTTTVEAMPPLGIPALKWAAVAGAGSYRLQISKDIAFTNVILEIATPNLTYTPADSRSFTDGTWYWHVRADWPSASNYSAPWSFTKQWATSTNLPALIAPANAATIDFYNSPSFSWSPVMGAAGYMLQIYTTPGGWSTPVIPAVTTVATTYQPTYKLGNGTYYWRVVPMDLGSHQGTPSLERKFNASYNFVPTLLEPLNGATPIFTPTFRWTAVQGAQFYRLQYTTSSDFTTDINEVDTANTSYTPITALPNDVDYFWRVRAYSGASISNWTNQLTPARSFKKRWGIPPVLLTPTDAYKYVRFPVFSWTPVPGAASYKFELSLDSGFASLYETSTTYNTFYTPVSYSGSSSLFYWRVTPYDGAGKAGVTSRNSSYSSSGQSVMPQLIYPLFYYTPDSYPPPFSGVTTNPHEDRTVPLPIFIWNRVSTPARAANEGSIYTSTYRLQVSSDPLFDSVNWTIDTPDTFAAPTTSNPFAPAANTTYYWRVCPLVLGACPLDDVNHLPMWSQRWAARFDSAKGLTPTSGASPQLIRPTDGFEYAMAAPLLEWFPLSGAATYEVQISNDQGFAAGPGTYSDTVSIPAYAVDYQKIEQDLGLFGVYYWRVRQAPGGVWSETRRFQVSAQSQWRATRTLGDAANQLSIGSDPIHVTASPDYHLTDLQAAQSMANWHFGFHVPAAPTHNVTYALYLDIDHAQNSGATTDAYIPAYNVTTIAAYRPEYIIYILQQAGGYAPDKVYIYHWNGSGWDTSKLLSDAFGGAINFNSTTHYVEIQVPNTLIGSQDTTGSYAVSLLSFTAGGVGAPLDSVPSDPNIPGSGAISRFANVTGRMNLVMPPNNAGVDPASFSTLQPFYWDWPVLAPWVGTVMKLYLDPQFTTEVTSYSLSSDTAYYAQTAHAWSYDLLGDNSYYWRMQPMYVGVNGGWSGGVWSQGFRFARKGLIPKNLQTSVTFATPTFSWDLLEGAQSYQLQVATDANFGSRPVDIYTNQNSYTPQDTLPGGFYYWRVRTFRNGNITNDWTTAQTFTLALPAPTGLTPPSTGPVIATVPTLCWTPVIKNSTAGTPVLAAWKYYVQISKDPAFSSIYNGYYIETEQNCWTPSGGFADGKYYWHVAMTDGKGRLGNYTAAQTFTKQYPITSLVSPISGNVIGTPTFIWKPVTGAASYKLEVSQSPTFSSILESAWVDNTRYTPNWTYPSGTIYWRIAMVDWNGNFGPFTNATIILVPPATPTPIPTTGPTRAPTKTRTPTRTPTRPPTKTRTPTRTPTRPPVTIHIKSIAAQDGWILESGRASTKGGVVNIAGTTIYLGDNAGKKQYRGILSFNTGAYLPDNAIITAVTLIVKQKAIIGSGNPIKLFQGLIVDVKYGPFGNVSTLQASDFQAVANGTYGPFILSPVSGWYSINLISAKNYVNKLSTNSGLTQIRLRFKLGDNNNSISNNLILYSSTVAASSPQLVITYRLP